jgi:hypothetical protein
MVARRNFFPDYDYLHSVFEIKDGMLYNKAQRNSRVKVGQLTGSNSGLYSLVFLNGIPWQVHRILFFMVHKFNPINVDHIDGNKQNNHIDNLRAATVSQNCANKGLTKANKSGVKGIHWAKTSSKWNACMKINGKSRNLGYFADLEDAKEFIGLAREMVFQEFANHG